MAELRTCEQLRGALDSLSAGNVAALQPETVSQLEAHLNACAACAACLTDRPAVAERVWLSGVPVPAETAWERVWQAVEHAAPASRIQRLRAGVVRHARVYGTLAAAAVLLLAIGIWHATTRPARLPVFQLARGSDVQIESIEVPADEMPMVISTDGDEGISIIWVVSREES
ncbi:MAG TPA: hypothetical protein VGM03_11510 [Phycisphaerae bacterium]|jgi:hypothetical protein